MSDQSVTSPARERVYQMLRSGMSEREIDLALRRGRHKSEGGDISQLISLARDRIVFENEGGPVRWRGPWPVSYVRAGGETVYRVGAGHDVPESALEAWGFRHG
jgi:hypothetical protein